MCFFFFRQKTAYELESRDWSSDVCSSDLAPARNTALNRHLTRVNPLFKAEADLVQANYIALSAFAAGTNGEFVKTVSVDGRVVTIRSGEIGRASCRERVVSAVYFSLVAVPFKKHRTTCL